MSTTVDFQTAARPGNGTAASAAGRNSQLAAADFGKALTAADLQSQNILAREQAAKSNLMALGIRADQDGNPLGFPKRVSWIDAQNMVTRNKVMGLRVDPARLESAKITARQMRPPSVEGLPEAERQRRLAQEKSDKELLLAAGIQETATGSPDGFPEGFSWSSLRKLAAQNVTEGVELDEDVLRRTYIATERLKEAGIHELHPSEFKSGTTVLSALEQVVQKNKNGILTRAMRQAGLGLENFPRPTTLYEAYKTVEDPQTPLGIDAAKAEDVKKAFDTLKLQGIANIQPFRSFGAKDASDALRLFNERPDKFRALTNTVPPSKAPWIVPNPKARLPGMTEAQVQALFQAPTGASGDQIKALAVSRAKLFNPSYSEKEIMDRFGFTTVRRLAPGERL
jgi:hypothetical protein